MWRRDSNPSELHSNTTVSWTIIQYWCDSSVTVGGVMKSKKAVRKVLVATSYGAAHVNSEVVGHRQGKF